MPYLQKVHAEIKSQCLWCVWNLFTFKLNLLDTYFQIKYVMYGQTLYILLFCVIFHRHFSLQGSLQQLFCTVNWNSLIKTISWALFVIYLSSWSLCSSFAVLLQTQCSITLKSETALNCFEYIWGNNEGFNSVLLLIFNEWLNTFPPPSHHHGSNLTSYVLKCYSDLTLIGTLWQAWAWNIDPKHRSWPYGCW